MGFSEPWFLSKSGPSGPGKANGIDLRSAEAPLFNVTP
jgi:hypothetical protein